MIEQISNSFGQLSGFVQHHLPVEQFPRADGVGFGLLAAGVILSVLGAKLARPTVTLGFTAAGVGLALIFGRDLEREFGFPLAASVAIGALAAGGIGYGLFRLWVGIGAAALLATVALSVYGSQRIVPHLAAFEEQYTVTTDYVIPDVSLEQRDPWDTLKTTSCDFWTYLKTKEADVGKKALLIAVAAGLVGLGLGLFAVRFSLVLFTALVGTGLVVSAIGLVLNHYHPDALLAVQHSPRAAGGAVLGFFGASVVLQALLTRRPPEPKPARPQ